VPSPQRFPPLTSDDFNRFIAGAEVPFAIFISRKCCRLTLLARREFRLAAQEFKAYIGVFEVDADVEKALVSRLFVKGIPTFLMFTSGTESLALLGFHSADELQKRVWSVISTEGDD